MTNRSSMIPVFYINLDARIDRRAHMEKQFEQLGIAAERISAVTVAEVPAALVARVQRPGHFYRVGTGDLACGLSHQRLWQTLVDRQLDEALVLEDDAILSPEVMPFLAPGLLARAGADLIRLETRRQAVRLGRPRFAVDGVQLRELLSTHRGTAGYLLSRAAAEAALASPVVNDMAVDRFLFGRFGPNLWRTTVLQADPSPIVQLDKADPASTGKALPVKGPAHSEIAGTRLSRPRRKRRVVDILAFGAADIVPWCAQALRNPQAAFARKRPVAFSGDIRGEAGRSI
ncbi:glycosyltransferase family 25 protein [Devosia sp.]|uniref:glycosyltransferase family 25 protein n=1 Tax=Devosia sp. TaxID=1871048 RepID=UPI001AD4E0E4|nr:glycosyltransferase family 25 protein [Devosia sp.]MBN9310933.1 glycosyltransferase family 25 protein [Devosia sp.]